MIQKRTSGIPAFAFYNTLDMKFGLIPEYAMGCDGTTTKVTITQG